MRKIKDIISKPSEALQAMVDGLLEQNARPDFRIDMNTFGSFSEMKHVCYGCAATCAVQKLIGVNFNKENINLRGLAVNIEHVDLSAFEWRIDMARMGLLRLLFLYFGFDDNILDIGSNLTTALFCLENHNWRQELPKVTAHIKLLQEEGY